MMKRNFQDCPPRRHAGTEAQFRLCAHHAFSCAEATYSCPCEPQAFNLYLELGQEHWAGGKSIRICSAHLRWVLVLAANWRNRIIEGRSLAVGCDRSHHDLQKGAPS